VGLIGRCHIEMVGLNRLLGGDAQRYVQCTPARVHMYGVDMYTCVYI
jgi:hypothetical protein